MRVQIEITTRCNFDCFYCAGRLMRQGDMSLELFDQLLAAHVREHGVPDVVSLQGEGEPTLHADFFRMADRVRALGSRPYSITNGSYRHPEDFIGRFPELGLSIDTLDEGVAHEIGRYNLTRVLAFAETLKNHLIVVVHSVAHEAHTPKIAAWCEAHGFPHIVQPLQAKADYAHRYPLLVPAITRAPRFSCRYLAQPDWRYFALDGTEMPCCYIKDTSKYPGRAAMDEHQRSGTWPESCLGCRFGAAAGT